jgi:hypothetical protein
VKLITQVRLPEEHFLEAAALRPGSEVLACNRT